MAKQIHAVHIIIINLIRLILILTFAYSSTSHRPLVQAVSAVAFIITFIPGILKNVFKINIPAAFEIIYIMFLYGLLIFGETRGFYHGHLWWEILMNLTASIALGLVGLSIVYVLYKRRRISASPIFAAILIFIFAVSMGNIWELFEFALDALVKSGLQKSLTDTMVDLSINIFGAIIVSTVGYFHIKKGNNALVSTFFSSIVDRNLYLISPRAIIKNPREQVIELIKMGETSQIEFKSTLRTNIHTKKFDKNIEHSVLKTIVAFLNSSGGNLLIGLDDKKNILGIENDNFQDEDKFRLHLTNLIKSHIGNQFLPFIKFEIIKIQDKKIFRIICKESPKAVFLKMPETEEFFIRNGPASLKLEGRSLIEYIQNKFNLE